jgi:uncharacterized protein (DUF952 family)
MELVHVLTREAWETACRTGAHAPPELARDGFLHCCTDKQLDFVLRRHFAGAVNLVAIVFATEGLDGAIRWVKSEADQDPFPHLYGPIPTRQVCRSRAIQWEK